MKTALLLAGAVLLCILLAGCAAGPNQLAKSANRDGKVAGFWLGLWHGLIAPVTFIISLFTKSVQMYEVHNNGGWYNFGYLLGLACVLGGGGASSHRRN